MTLGPPVKGPFIGGGGDEKFIRGAFFDAKLGGGGGTPRFVKKKKKHFIRT